MISVVILQLMTYLIGVLNRKLFLNWGNPSNLDGDTLPSTYHRDSGLPCTYGFYLSNDQLDNNSFTFANIIQPKDHINSFKIDKLQLMQEKEKSVLWYFSHCAVKFREEYAQNLVGSGTKIVMYGKCTKPDPCKNRNKCTVEMYKKYKFYLAFENIPCFDYITEKAWKSLLYGMVPIINGAPLESCKYHLPPNSFSHVPKKSQNT